MGFLPFLTAGMGALSSLFGSSPGARTSTFNQTQNQSGTSSQNQQQNQFYSGSQVPVMNPAQLSILQNLLPRLMGSQDVNLSGYASQGMQNINQTAGLRDRAVQQMMAQRGLTNSPMAAIAQTTGENTRVSDIGSLLNQLPLLQHQYGQENIANLMNLFSRIPIGQTTSGTSTGTSSGGTTFNTTGTSSGSQTGPGSQVGSTLGALGQFLPFLFPQQFQWNNGMPYAGAGGGGNYAAPSNPFTAAAADPFANWQGMPIDLTPVTSKPPNYRP